MAFWKYNHNIFLLGTEKKLRYKIIPTCFILLLLFQGSDNSDLFRTSLVSRKGKQYLKNS